MRRRRPCLPAALVIGVMLAIGSAGSASAQDGQPTSSPSNAPSDDATTTPTDPLAPTLTVAVEPDVVLDLTLMDRVDVDIAVTLHNPSEDAITDVVVTLDGATTDQAMPERLEAGQTVAVAATADVGQDDLVEGMVTVRATLDALRAGQPVTARAVGSAPLTVISASSIDRDDPAPLPPSPPETDEPATPSDEPPPDVEVLDDVVEATPDQAPAAEPGTPLPEDGSTAAVDTLPLTGASATGLATLAALALALGFALRRGQPRRPVPAGARPRR